MTVTCADQIAKESWSFGPGVDTDTDRDMAGVLDKCPTR